MKIEGTQERERTVFLIFTDGELGLRWDGMETIWLPAATSFTDLCKTVFEAGGLPWSSDQGPRSQDREQWLVDEVARCLVVLDERQDKSSSLSVCLH